MMRLIAIFLLLTRQYHSLCSDLAKQTTNTNHKQKDQQHTTEFLLGKIKRNAAHIICGGFDFEPGMSRWKTWLFMMIV